MGTIGQRSGMRFEGTADRATRALGFPKTSPASGPTPETFTDIATRTQAEAGERRARELEEDAASNDEGTDDGGESPGNTKGRGDNSRHLGLRAKAEPRLKLFIDEMKVLARARFC